MKTHWRTRMSRPLGWEGDPRERWIVSTALVVVAAYVAACAPTHGRALAGSPCPNWIRVAPEGSRGQPASLALPGDQQVHDQEYFVEVDSALKERGCFADSLALALGARVNWVYRFMSAFTISHLPDSSVALVRRTPHVIMVEKTETFLIRDTIHRVP